jgi:hypothetical protein
MKTLTLALLLVAAMGSFASAAPPKKEPAEASDVQKAKELFGWAQKLYKQARYQEAIAKFEEAYAVRPHPVIFFNIGKCYEQLGETAKAMRAYKDYLRLAPDAPDKETVTDAIANLERRLKEKGVQQLMVYADPQTASINVDGKDLGSSPASVELQAGNHKLTVKADGYETVERSLVMSVQHSTEITINLRPKQAEQPTPPVAEKTPPADAPKQVDLVPPPPPPTVVEQPKKGGRLFTYVAGGVAVVGLGAAVTFGLLSNGNLSTLKGSVHSQMMADGYISSAKTDAMVANISYGVAGAALAAAVVLFFLEGS